jgi:ParB family chromosome partitioning protein
MTEPRTPRRVLGRGLDALLPPAPSAVPPGFGERSVFLCPVELLVAQQGQPRQHFDEAELAELTESIREHGVIEPIVVRRVPSDAGAKDRFEIIAGERRWRAAQRAGLREMLVVVKDVSPKGAFELALVENLQRADLNPIEVAESFDRLLREHDYTQDALAQRVGKDRSTITNSLRLLKLPPRVRTLVIGRELTEGHARALLGAPSQQVLEEVAEKVVRGRLPVRRTEELVRAAKRRAEATPDAPTPPSPTPKTPEVRHLETRLQRLFGSRVEVRKLGRGGELAIPWSDLDDLDRLLQLLGLRDDDDARE